jgi:tetratricopeptide (TPR) repeat protein
VVNDTLSRLIDTRAISYERKPDPGRVWLHPLDADHVRKSLIHDDPALQIRLDLKLADWYRSSRTPPESWRSLADVAPNVHEFEHRWRAAREPAEYTAAMHPLAEAAIQIARKGEGRRLFAAVKTVESKVTEPAGLLYVEECRFWAEFFGGSLERAEQAARNAVETAERAGTPSEAAEMQLRLGEVLRHRGTADDAVAVLQELLRRDEASVARETRIFAIFELGLSLCYLADWDGARAAADQLASEVTADDDATLRALEFDVRCLAQLGDHDYAGAIATATDGIAIYCESASQDNAGYLQNVRGLARMHQDDLDGAEREFQEATGIATQYGQARLEGLCAINLAWHRMRTARWSEAFTFASRAAECLTLVNARERVIAGQLVSALTEAQHAPTTPLLDALNAAALGSRENADLYSPSEEQIAGLSQDLAARQGLG